MHTSSVFAHRRDPIRTSRGTGERRTNSAARCPRFRGTCAVCGSYRSHVLPDHVLTWMSSPYPLRRSGSARPRESSARLDTLSRVCRVPDHPPLAASRNFACDERTPQPTQGRHALLLQTHRSGLGRCVHQNTPSGECGDPLASGQASVR